MLGIFWDMKPSFSPQSSVGFEVQLLHFQLVSWSKLDQVDPNLKVPSGYVKIAIENGPLTASFPIEKW